LVKTYSPAYAAEVLVKPAFSERAAELQAAGDLAP
jgi:hypothetical protein